MVTISDINELLNVKVLVSITEICIFAVGLLVTVSAATRGLFHSIVEI